MHNLIVQDDMQSIILSINQSINQCIYFRGTPEKREDVFSF